MDQPPRVEGWWINASLELEPEILLNIYVCKVRLGRDNGIQDYFF